MFNHAHGCLTRCLVLVNIEMSSIYPLHTFTLNQLCFFCFVHIFITYLPFPCLNLLPSVAISQSVTPYAHTSEADVNSLLVMDSIAIHFQGMRPRLFLTYTSFTATILDMPKSDILRDFPSSTKILRQARSLWTMPRLARNSYGDKYYDVTNNDGLSKMALLGPPPLSFSLLPFLMLFGRQKIVNLRSLFLPVRHKGRLGWKQLSQYLIVLMENSPQELVSGATI